MEAAASAPLGVAKPIDRTPHAFLCARTHPTATPAFTHNNCLALAPSTVCQNDKTGDRECLLHKDERNSTAEEEQLSKQLRHRERPYLRKSTMRTLSLEKVRWESRSEEQLQWLGQEGPDQQAEGLVTRL